MPRESKGDRFAHTVRPPREVSERLRTKAVEAGASSVSQYVADLLAIHVGLPHLVRELGQDKEVLPLAI
jgi:hypothetical protein